MESKELTKEEIYHILFFLEEIDRGSYGVIKKVNNDVCMKIYYKDIFNTYAQKNIDALDDDINLLIKVYEENASNKTVQETRENERKKLEYLYKIGLVRRVLTYKGYIIGIEMNYYKDYIPLSRARDFLERDDYKKILYQIRTKLDELLKNNIFPEDLSRSNILINIRTLDVVFIDLDDCYTKYEDEDYLVKMPQLRKSLTDRCNKKYQEIERNINR